jgi:hypothetical protein
MLNPDLNNLNPLNFRFILTEVPNVEFRVQSVEVPGMELGMAPVTNPFIRVQDTGSLEYGPLSISFLVGENMNDYLEIFDWMVDMGMPDGLGTYNRRFSDGSVLILNSSYKKIIEVKFTNLFPISISPLSFNTTDSDVQFIRATATFNFDRFYFNRTRPE